MDVQQPCNLCPRLLYQSGKRCADKCHLTKTPCDHYFHPACWQRYFKTTKPISNSSCPCPTCHRTVVRDAAVEITVSRDKILLEEIIQKNVLSTQLCSPTEEARLQQARAILEERSRRQQSPQRTSIRRRPRKDPISASKHLNETWKTKLLGTAIVAFAIVVLLGIRNCDQPIAEPDPPLISNFNVTGDEVIANKTVIVLSRMLEIVKKRTRLATSLYVERKIYTLNNHEISALGKELEQENAEWEYLRAQMEQNEMQEELRKCQCSNNLLIFV